MRKILLSFVALLAFAGAWAQGVTTSSISGTVKDESGADLPGANIVAVHEPSGTTYGSTTLADGRFFIPNMRVGGPYKVSISFVGYKTEVYSGVYLKLGDPFTLKVELKQEGTELEELVVLGTEDRLLNSSRNGALTSISTRELQTMPTISRSMNDMLRFTPQASSTSTGAIGGGNYRQNYITVDGSDFNNTFGIGTNLPANGSPISLDALEEVSVNIAPFDIRQSGFVGSSVNAVTRSGTNDFAGSAYTFWRNQNQQGHKVGDNTPFKRQDLQVNTYGFRLGGPIIKNKLFFFVNVEKGSTTSPGQTNVAANDDAPYGSAPNIARPTETELNDIRTYLKNNFNYETGPYQGYDFKAENTRIVGRVDWNINSNHRISIRYSQVESKSPSFMSGSTGGAGFNYGSGAGRTNINSLWFANSNYYQESNFYSLALEANSLFFGKFANTFRVTQTHQNDPRSSNSKVFPFVDILDGSGVPFTSFGYEPFTYGNLRDVKSYSVVDFVTWTSGMHNFTGGFQLDFQSTKNGFQRYGTGYYVFNSWADFTGGVNPRDYVVTYSLLPGFKQAYPKVGFAQYSVYGQDEMTITDRLRVTVGLRLDLPTFPSVPEIKTHPLVAELTFVDNKKFDTGALPDPRIMASPRVGFNWDIKGDRSLQLRGGTGVFTGRVPTVWIVAQSGDAGLLQFTQNYNGQGNTPGPFQVDPYRPVTPPTPGSAIPSTVSAIDPNFKFPQTWKTSLALDAKLPWGLVGTVEVLYNKDIHTALGKNMNLVDPEPLNVDGYPDNRPIYPRFNTQKFLNPLIGGQAVAPGTTTNGLPLAGNGSNDAAAFNPIMLSNGSNGYYYSVTGKLEKQFNKGFSAMIAYTRSQAKVLYDGVGDQLLNTWSLNQITGNANNPQLARANYIVPDRVIASLSYRKEYLKYFATTISMFFEGSIQGTYSYTYGGDLNRDGQNNDLIYVPKDPSEITFTDFTYSGVLYTAKQQSDLFFRMIEQDKYLSSRKGKYAERNGAKLPWRNQVDIRLTQDIFTNIGGRKNTLQFTLDIFNFGNLLNKHWGTYDLVNASSILVPTNQNNLVAGGTVKPTFRLQTDRNQPVTTTFRDNNTITSTYYMQFGLRYIFN